MDTKKNLVYCPTMQYLKETYRLFTAANHLNKLQLVGGQLQEDRGKLKNILKN